MLLGKSVMGTRVVSAVWTKLIIFIMARVSPFHSIKQDVHHNNNSCTEGNNIEKENLRSGTGDKPLCKHCKALS